MYWCLDGILTCPDLSCARPVRFRRPYVPNLGSQTAPGTATWAPCTSTWAPQTDLKSQDTSTRPPGSIFDQLWTPPGSPAGSKTL